MIRMLPSDSDNPLRDDIFALLNTKKAPIDKALEALSQCQAHITNRILVERTAKECGLRLSRLLASDDLELYYDIKRGRHDLLGYISKGWTDPGFRTGDLLKVPQSKVDLFKKNAYQLLKFCATNGIVITVEETRDSIDIAMSGVIYSEGFNKDTFKKTLETLNECIEKAEELIGINV